MFALRHKEINPLVIMPAGNGRTSDSYDRVEIKGRFLRVYPVSAREINALRLLDHRQDKFAPANGNGVIIRPDALTKFLSTKTNRQP